VSASLSSAFWDRFVKATWDRGPAVFRGVVKDSVITPAELFDILKVATSRVSDRTELGQIRFYGDAYNGQVLEDYRRYLPKKRETSFAAYRARLREELDAKRWGIVLNAVHRRSPSLWSRARDLVSGLFARTGYPAGGVSVTSFLGPYRTTPFGIHKDSEHVFTLPVAGEKVFHLWPYEQLAELMRAGSSLLYDEARTPYRQRLPRGLRPVELRARPGDLMYWPPSYWHVGRGDGRFNASVTVGVEWTRPTRKALLGWVERSSRQDGGGATSPARAAEARAKGATRIATALAVRLRGDELRVEIEHESRRAISGLCFHPPVEPLATTRLSSDDAVVSDARFPILVRTFGERMVCFANGHALAMGRSRAVERLVRELNRGGTFSVSSLAASCLRWSVADGVEVDARALRTILDRLVSVQAVQALAARRPDNGR
jgi:hypothetical protein